MFGIAKWTFAGASGAGYTMRVKGMRNALPSVPAVYVCAYLHPKGHLAGHVAEPVFIGATDDLAATMQDHPAVECLRYECANCVCWLECDASDERQRIVDDLEKVHPAKC